MPKNTTCNPCQCSYVAANITAEKYYLDSAVCVDTPEQFLAYGCFNLGIARQTFPAEPPLDYCTAVFYRTPNMGINQYIQSTGNGGISANQSHPAVVDESPPGQSPQQMTFVESDADSDCDELNAGFDFKPYWYCVIPWLVSPELYLQVKMYCDTDSTTDNTREANGGVMLRLAWSSSSTFGVEDATPCVGPLYVRPLSYQGATDDFGNFFAFNYGFAACIGQACGGKPCQDCYFSPNSLGNNRIQNWYGSLPNAYTVTMPNFSCAVPANCPQCAGLSGTHTLSAPTPVFVGSKCGWSWNYNTTDGIALHIYGPGNGGNGSGMVQLAVNFSAGNGNINEFDGMYGSLPLDQFDPNGTNTFNLQYGLPQNTASCPLTDGFTATVAPVAPFRMAEEVQASPQPVQPATPKRGCGCGRQRGKLT
jgi:hypothetical protein